jgi:hypothetical protein
MSWLFWIVILLLPIVLGIFVQRAIVKKDLSKSKRIIFSSINLVVITLVIPLIEVLLIIFTSNSDPAASGWLLVFYVMFSPVLLGVNAIILFIANWLFQKRLNK